MRKKKNTEKHTKPVLRLRLVIAGVAVLALLISGPLIAVWKQVYINNTSLQMDEMADSLILLKKQVAVLTLEYERLSGIERIEKIAKEKLDLDFPSSNQITIVKIKDKSKELWLYTPKELLAIFRKTITGDKG
jgi:cell division protein FtsL